MCVLNSREKASCHKHEHRTKLDQTRRLVATTIGGRRERVQLRLDVPRGPWLAQRNCARLIPSPGTLNATTQGLSTHIETIYVLALLDQRKDN